MIDKKEGKDYSNMSTLNGIKEVIWMTRKLRTRKNYVLMSSDYSQLNEVTARTESNDADVWRPEND